MTKSMPAEQVNVEKNTAHMELEANYQLKKAQIIYKGLSSIWLVLRVFKLTL